MKKNVLYLVIAFFCGVILSALVLVGTGSLLQGSLPKLGQLKTGTEAVSASCRIDACAVQDSANSMHQAQQAEIAKLETRLTEAETSLKALWKWQAEAHPPTPVIVTPPGS